MTQPADVPAILAHVVERHAAPCAEELYLRMVTARDLAPPGEEDTYVAATRDAYLQTFCRDGERIVANLGASVEQITTFAHALGAAFLARLDELKAGGASSQKGRA